MALGNYPPASDTSDQTDYSAEGGPISDTATATPTTTRNGSAVTLRPIQSEQSSRPSLPQPNLDRAYHTLDFLQRNPQWLANPYTAHAANAVLDTSSKMIEMSIQLERVNAMADSTKNKNAFLKTKVNDLSKVTPFIPGDDAEGQAELGRLNGMIGSEDFSLPEFSMGVARLQSKYSPKPGSESLTMADGTVLHGYKDRFGNFHQSAMQTIEARDKVVSGHIQQRGEVQAGLAKARFQNEKDLMKERSFWSSLGTEEKTILGRIGKDYDSATRMIENLQKAGVTEDDPRMISAVGKRYLVAERQQKFLDAVRPESPSSQPAPSSTPDSTTSASAAETQPGQIYKGYKFIGGDKTDKNNWQKVQ